MPGGDIKTRDRNDASSAASRQQSSPSLAEALLQGPRGPTFKIMLRAVVDWQKLKPATASKNYEQRRERQAQGIEKAKAAGKYQGRPVNEDLHKRVSELLSAGIAIRQLPDTPNAHHGSFENSRLCKPNLKKPKPTEERSSDDRAAASTGKEGIGCIF